MKSITTLDAIRKYGWPVHRTKVCELTLNYNCNAKCVFCYSSPESEELENKNNLELKTAIRYLVESRERGSGVLQLIGGEPTIYPKLREVISAGRKAGYKVIQIVTNGQRMAERAYAYSLKEAGLNAVTFSIHADGQVLHDRMVGVKGAFGKMIKAVENAVRCGFHITVGTAVTALNYKNLPALVEFFHGVYGIESFHLIAVHFLGISLNNREILKVSYSETIPYIKKSLSRLASGGSLPISPVLSNYPPCVLPGFEHLVSDWKYPFNDDDLFLPEKVYRESMYTMITDNLRMKSKKCSSCIYSRICAGFERQYFKMFGSEEFKPLKSIAKPFPLAAFYKN